MTFAHELGGSCARHAPVLHHRIETDQNFFEWLAYFACKGIDATSSCRYIFRGQSACWPLQPSVGRSKELSNLEADIFGEFRRTAVPHLPQGNATPNWILLCIAQHRWLPTRLLDWTLSPLVAAYFAVEETSNNEKDGVIFSFRDVPAFVDVDKHPFTHIGSRVVKPPHVDHRIIVQSGLFTIHSAPNEYFKPPTLVQTSILASYKRVMKCILDNLGINGATLFPDLDGLAAYIRWTSFGRK